MSYYEPQPAYVVSEALERLGESIERSAATRIERIATAFAASGQPPATALKNAKILAELLDEDERS